MLSLMALAIAFYEMVSLGLWIRERIDPKHFEITYLLSRLKPEEIYYLDMKSRMIVLLLGFATIAQLIHL